MKYHQRDIVEVSFLFPDGTFKPHPAIIVSNDQLQEDWGDARQTSETIHKAVEDFVGGAEPSDDLTKMCIKMK